MQPSEQVKPVLPWHTVIRENAIDGATPDPTQLNSRLGDAPRLNRPVIRFSQPGSQVCEARLVVVYDENCRTYPRGRSSNGQSYSIIIMSSIGPPLSAISYFCTASGMILRNSDILSPWDG